MKPPTWAHHATPPADDGMQEVGNSLKDLDQEPESDKEHGGQLEKERQKQNRHEHDDASEWKQTHVTSEHARNRAGGAERRNRRCRIKRRLGERRGNTAAKIEDDIAAVTQPILDRRPEQPERPHVEDEMQPAAVQEHHRDEGKKIGRP